MGVRSALRKELMGLQDSSLLAADDVRALLTKAIKAQPDKSEQGFALISRFNDNHSQLAYGEESKEKLLEYQSLYFEDELIQKNINNIKTYNISNSTKRIQKLKIINENEWK